MNRVAGLLMLLLLLAGCQDGEINSESEEPPLRGLKTVLIKNQENTTVRRYPSVLQPADITTLSFEIAGKLGLFELKVGQQVKKGDVLAELDRRTLEIQVESSQAALEQAQSTSRNSAEDFQRQEALFKKKVTTNAALNNSRTSMETSQAQVAQANKQLETSRENLAKADLKAPFDGIVNSVEVESFANVGAGSPVATVYSVDGFQSSFSVSYDVISRIAIGKNVKIRSADNPDIVLDGIVTELGSRADTVSSFPIVVSLKEMHADLKAGMAVEISLELAVPLGQGFTLPLSVLNMEGSLRAPGRADQPGEVSVFVFDEETSTVNRRLIKVAGVRENQIIAVEGLKAGERVASAGVSFLHDGQKVKLLVDGR
jgi:RND family efflux transporter MFP subunit